MADTSMVQGDGRRARSGRLDEAVDHLLAARLLERDVELVAVDHLDFP